MAYKFIGSEDYLTSLLTDLSKNPELKITPEFIENVKKPEVIAEGGYLNSRLAEMFNSFGASIMNAKLVELGVYDTASPPDTQEYRDKVNNLVDSVFPENLDCSKDNVGSDALLCEWYYGLNSEYPKDSAGQMKLFNKLLDRASASKEELDSIVKEVITTIRTAHSSGILQQIKEANYTKSIMGGVNMNPYWFFEILPIK